MKELGADSWSEFSLLAESFLQRIVWENKHIAISYADLKVPVTPIMDPKR